MRLTFACGVGGRLVAAAVVVGLLALVGPVAQNAQAAAPTGTATVDSSHGATAAHGAAADQGVAHGGEHAKKGGLPQLDPGSFPTQLFWLGVCFTILYFLLAEVALPRVQEVVETRESRIAHDLDRADELRAEAATLAAETDKLFAEARTRAQTAVAKVLDEVDKFRHDKLVQLEQDMERRLAEGEARVQAAKKAALADISAGAADLASSVVTRVSGREIGAAQVATVVAELVGGQQA